MAERKQRPALHPDDLMVVTVSLDFRAKLNPTLDDPPPFDSVGWQSTLKASDAANYLEGLARAIRERRLYGHMVQQGAEAAVGAGEWIEMTSQEIIAEAQEKLMQKSGQKDTDI